MLKILFVLFIFVIFYQVLVIIMVLLILYRRGRNLSKDFTLDEYKINFLDDDMLYKPNSPYISKFPINLITILWKYDINRYGPVWRWSKLHKEIEEKFKQLRNE